MERAENQMLKDIKNLRAVKGKEMEKHVAITRIGNKFVYVVDPWHAGFGTWGITVRVFWERYLKGLYEEYLQQKEKDPEFKSDIFD